MKKPFELPSEFAYAVYTYNEILGSHCWPDAPDQFYWLRDDHVHHFEITCLWSVEGPDRELEIFKLQDQIKRFVYGMFPARHFTGCDFGTLSCEEIGEKIMSHFEPIIQIKVLEDGKGGGLVWRR